MWSLWTSYSKYRWCLWNWQCRKIILVCRIGKWNLGWCYTKYRCPCKTDRRFAAGWKKSHMGIHWNRKQALYRYHGRSKSSHFWLLFENVRELSRPIWCLQKCNHSKYDRGWSIRNSRQYGYYKQFWTNWKSRSRQHFKHYIQFDHYRNRRSSGTCWRCCWWYNNWRNRERLHIWRQHFYEYKHRLYRRCCGLCQWLYNDSKLYQPRNHTGRSGRCFPWRYTWIYKCLYFPRCSKLL